MFNKVFLIGRLTKDVELRTTPNGKSVASTSIATNKKWKDQNGQMQEKAEFHNLVIWQGAEAFAQYLSKGNKVFIEGELTNRSWEDKTTGQKRYATDVKVNEFIFLDSKQVENKNNDYNQNNNNDYSEQESRVEEIDIKEIPF